MDFKCFLRYIAPPSSEYYGRYTVDPHFGKGLQIFSDFIEVDYKIKSGF